MKTFRILPEVVEDVAAAARWYDTEGYPGLGDRFVAIFDAYIRQLQETGQLREAKIHFEHAMAFLDRMPPTRDNQRRRVSLVANQFLVFFYLYQQAEYLELLRRYETLAVEQEDAGLLGLFYLAPWGWASAAQRWTILARNVSFVLLLIVWYRAAVPSAPRPAQQPTVVSR